MKLSFLLYLGFIFHHRYSHKAIGGHLVPNPWSVISDWAWYWNVRYRTERTESDILSDIGIKFYPKSDIPIETDRHRNLVLSRSLTVPRSAGSNLQGEKFCFSSMSDIGMNSDVDIRTLPISEWCFSVRHICLRYRNNRCRCRISPTLRSMSMPTYA